MNEDLMPIIDRALGWGILGARVIPAEDVVIADWVTLKCRYGCPSYGSRLDCPPASPGPDLMRRVLKEYRRALVLKLRRLRAYDPRESGLVHRLERELLLNQFYRAFALGAGACGECQEECVREPGKCPKPHNIRPSAESMGVDWFATLRNAGWDILVRVDREELPPSYSLILID